MGREERPQTSIWSCQECVVVNVARNALKLLNHAQPCLIRPWVVLRPGDSTPLPPWFAFRTGDNNHHPLLRMRQCIVSILGNIWSVRLVPDAREQP